MNLNKMIKSVMRFMLPAYRVALRIEEKPTYHIWKSQPKPMLTLEVQLAEHCNLNCAYCDHCSPVAEHEFLDIRTFTRDMARLSELFDGEMQFIKLMGGEPLLNREIVEFMRVAREAFPAGDILVVTNGLILPKMPEGFWLACVKYRVIISPTKYPVDYIDYAASEALAEKYGVEYVYYGEYYGLFESEKSMSKQLFDLDGRHDPRESFFRCNSSNNCLFLQRGRMFTCPVAATSRHFSKYFGKELRISDRDSIDIYKAHSGQEILEFLSRPIPFCRYCDKDNCIAGLPWKVSEKSISEWTL